MDFLFVKASAAYHDLWCSIVCDDGSQTQGSGVTWQCRRRWPVGGPRESRPGGYCSYEAALPWVTCCPLSPRYLSLTDTSLLFLSKPLLFHLPIFSFPLLVLARVLRSFRQDLLPGPRHAVSTPLHHPHLGHMTSSLNGLPNNGGQAMGWWVRVQTGWVALTGWRAFSQWSTRGVITSLSWSWNWTSWPLKSPWAGWDAVPPFIRRAACVKNRQSEGLPLAGDKLVCLAGWEGVENDTQRTWRGWGSHKYRAGEEWLSR